MSERNIIANAETVPAILLDELRKLILLARQRVATSVNSELTLLHWRMGHRINSQVLAGQRAQYGQEILLTLSAALVKDYGRGFTKKNLRRMVQFATVFPDESIVVTLSRQLGWSHFVR